MIPVGTLCLVVSAPIDVVRLGTICEVVAHQPEAERPAADHVVRFLRDGALRWARPAQLLPIDAPHAPVAEPELLEVGA